MEMTEATLKALCKKNDLFLTPSLNDKLFVNYGGFAALGGLENYTGIKALFAEGNAFDNLEGLPPMPQLKCL